MCFTLQTLNIISKYSTQPSQNTEFSTTNCRMLKSCWHKWSTCQISIKWFAVHNNSFDCLLWDCFTTCPLTIEVKNLKTWYSRCRTLFLYIQCISRLTDKHYCDLSAHIYPMHTYKITYLVLLSFQNNHLTVQLSALIETNTKFSTSLKFDFYFELRWPRCLIYYLYGNLCWSVERCGDKGTGKVLPYSLPSVGLGADLHVQAVSPQVTLSHPPSGKLPLPSARRPAVTFPAEERHHPMAGTKLCCLVTQAHACGTCMWAVCPTMLPESGPTEIRTHTRPFGKRVNAVPFRHTLDPQNCQIQNVHTSKFGHLIPICLRRNLCIRFYLQLSTMSALRNFYSIHKFMPIRSKMWWTEPKYCQKPNWHAYV